MHTRQLTTIHTRQLQKYTRATTVHSPKFNISPFTNFGDQTASETWTLTKRDRKKLNIFERKMYRRILGPVYANEKESFRILAEKEIYARVKKTYYNRDNKLK